MGEPSAQGMSSALMLGLQLNLCGIYSVTDLVEHLRTDPNALAMLLDGEFTHTLLATTTVMADVETQADVLQVAAPPPPARRALAEGAEHPLTTKGTKSLLWQHGHAASTIAHQRGSEGGVEISSNRGGDSPER